MTNNETKRKRPTAKELLELARAHGMSDEQIRNAIGAGRTTMWRWETGEADMPPRRRAELIAAFAI